MSSGSDRPWGEIPKVWPDVAMLLDREYGGKRPVRALIDSGFDTQAVYEFCYGTRGKWRQSMALSGGGQLNDSGSHLIDILLWTTGLAADEGIGLVFVAYTNLNTGLVIDLGVQHQRGTLVAGQAECLAVGGELVFRSELVAIRCFDGVSEMLVDK